MKRERITRVLIFDNLAEPTKASVSGKRPREALEKLISAGRHGVTTATHFNAGVRVSDSIFKLRKVGIPISAEREPNSDGDGGTHAKYRLGCKVEILSDAQGPAHDHSPPQHVGA
ncbi:MAG TPA: hypothetical protein VM325_17230 [Alphaproteobacteria bacterium]|nr:hypothetical protein [Alphaproteobacteria bacterium]